MRSIIELKSPYEKLKLLSKIYPYNSSLLIIAGGNAIFSKKKREDINGYVPLTRVWNDSIKSENPLVEYAIDTTKVKVYESFIRDCLSLKVKLYISCSPHFIKYTHKDYSIKLAEEIANRYNVKFFDHLQDSVFINNSELFADPLHLNDKGARLFSINIVDSILSN